MITLNDLPIGDRQQIIQLVELSNKTLTVVMDDFNKTYDALVESFPDESPNRLYTRAFRTLQGRYSRNHFFPAIWASNILRNHYVVTPDDSLLPHLYTNGYYLYSTEDIYLQKIVSNELGVHSTPQKILNVIKSIVIDTAKPISTNNPDNPWICCKNGLYNLKTGEFTKHTPRKLLFTKFLIDYNPDINTDPMWNYLDVLTDNNDKIQEIIGDILNSHNYSKKVHFFFGIPNSGKTTFVQLLERFVGKNNYCNLTIGQLQQTFIDAEIYNKLLNTKAEMSYKTRMTIKDAHIIKEMSGGGDGITIQRKFGHPFKYKPIAKHIFSGNNIPVFDKNAQSTDGFLERLDFTEFTGEHKKNDEFLTKITTPNMLSQLLMIAIEGNKRLRKNKWEFTNQSSVEEVKTYLKNAKLKDDSFIDWLKDRCLPDHTETPKADLFRDCRAWHEVKGLDTYPLNITQFGIAMSNQLFIKVESCRIRDEPCYRGIKLKT